MTLSVIVFAWSGWWTQSEGVDDGRPKPEHVTAMRNMFATHLTREHRFICVTDKPELYDCETFPLWEVGEIKGWRTHLNCFHRLRLYSEWAKCLGDVLIQADLDMLIRRNIDDLVTHHDVRLLKSEDFSRPEAIHYNGGFQLIRPGTRAYVWDQFDPETAAESIYAARDQRHFLLGSDQAWLTVSLPPNEATYSERDGFYLKRPGDEQPIPEWARVVSFVGSFKPWNTPPYTDEWRSYL